jgi:chemotaxis protein methyltransferase CheR
MQNSDDSITYKEYLHILKGCSPYDFCEYSDNSIDRRIQKVMRDYNLNMAELIYRTRNDEEFVEQVVEAITVNTTELFRDPIVWSYLHSNILPKLKSLPKINIWHAGCSTGQEVYSHVIMLHSLGLLEKANIVASDISKKALEIAKKASYKDSFNRQRYLENFANSFPPDKQPKFDNYFDISDKDDLLILKPEFKDAIKFVKHDLVKEDLPFYNKFDIIFCRNVLIYFNGNLQSKIIQRFHDNLVPSGTMILGTHETINGFFKTKFIRKGPVYTRTGAFHLKY